MNAYALTLAGLDHSVVEFVPDDVVPAEQQNVDRRHQELQQENDALRRELDLVRKEVERLTRQLNQGAPKITAIPFHCRICDIHVHPRSKMRHITSHGHLRACDDSATCNCDNPSTPISTTNGPLCADCGRLT
jgi:hypothetical protein